MKIQIKLLSRIARDILDSSVDEEIEYDDFQKIVKKVLRNGYETELPDMPSYELGLVFFQLFFIKVMDQQFDDEKCMH